MVNDFIVHYLFSNLILLYLSQLTKAELNIVDVLWCLLVRRLLGHFVLHTYVTLHANIVRPFAKSKGRKLRLLLVRNFELLPTSFNTFFVNHICVFFLTKFRKSVWTLILIYNLHVRNLSTNMETANVKYFNSVWSVFSQ